MHESTAKSCCTKNSSNIPGTVRDPVCGMQVDRARAADVKQFKDVQYYFCSKSCAKRFLDSPDQYLTAKSPVSETKGDKTRIYTCPMHPEIKQIGVGSCPKCGMALEPEVLSLSDTVDPELVDMQLRLIVSALLTTPLFLSSMGAMIPYFHELFSSLYLSWLQALLATVVVWWAGWPLIVRGIKSFLTRNLNMFSLIAIGTVTAYCYSLALLMYPKVFRSLVQDGHRDGFYFESAAMIVCLVLLGQVLELRARAKTGSALGELLRLVPPTAWVVREDGSEEERPLSAVAIGDLIRVKPGAKIAVDGEVVEGRSLVDLSLLTGEAIPVEVAPGCSVIGGSLNTSGSFCFRAKKLGNDTVLAGIIAMVSKAQRSRAPIQQLADKMSAYFVPAVILVSILTAAVWMAIGPEPKLSHALVNAVAVLIIACPCALGLATPMSIMVGVGRGARSGILVKNAEDLQTLAAVDTILFDKTGTLTMGRPQLISQWTAKDFDRLHVLQLAASVEQNSEHPLARALLDAAQSNQLQILAVSDFKAIASKGITAQVDNKIISVGNRQMMIDAGCDVVNEPREVIEMRKSGYTVVYILSDKTILGAFAVGDQIKADAAAAIESIKAIKINTAILTGDHSDSATTVARAVGIDQVHASMMPADKLGFIRHLQQQGHKVAMVGDGVNDAPALAQADVGIAMGSGTDVAMGAAGLTLLSSNLKTLVAAISLSRDTITNIKQNLAFAFIYNIVGVPIAAGILYPVFGLLLSPMLASAAMSLSSFSVIVNALRLR